ncbi:sensor domain-containing diguanylate cyclase [Methylophaga sp. OBS1]|uniref:GGDEF domain-containing protein n=1 Tax=Methylophaga sp. OBS1 TaxID=2991933 RepID=UPI0022570150|nr:sensor domain-containing diguanylate cyclase [Methylophaga sp. OBS1]MCX4191334.1 sensor domain-containing diguanylate cyclase [Methylophaga sp. OBS1]MCX4191720.1 sensor domain-containing diguanylate cyclase [Methylophaga sp. OBS1]
MQIPAKPVDEESRIVTLRSLNLLDTDRDERFDRLTRLALHVFEVPVALVSLVDENRQWFKSCQGANLTETDRDVSFCGHAILGDEAFVIEDTHQDPRFADNPLVIGEPHIRFYAGYPIRYLDGKKLGTLCLLDSKPRHFSRRERLILEDLAKIVEHEIQAVQLATVDELTEIPNRRGFFSNANQALSLCQRQNLPVSLVFLDLNNFKPINDQFGHAEGDKALKTFSSMLKKICRQSDIAARIGGDEFALLLPNTNKSDVDKILTRFTGMVEQANREQPLDYKIAYSHGVVHFDPAKHQDLDDLLAEGDQLMYQRKNRSKKEQSGR